MSVETMGPGDLVRVIKGTPDDVELAALVAGLVAAGAASTDDPDDGSRSSIWADPRRRWGVPATPSRGSWRWSTHQAW